MIVHETSILLKSSLDPAFIGFLTDVKYFLPQVRRDIAHLFFYQFCFNNSFIFQRRQSSKQHVVLKKVGLRSAGSYKVKSTHPKIAALFNSR